MSEEIFVSFFYTYRRGLGIAAMNQLRRIQEAADTDWRAAVWLLERRFPERWSKYSGDIRRMKREIDLLTASITANHQPPDGPHGDAQYGTTSLS